MESDLVYEDLERSFPLQNMHVKDVHTGSSAKFVPQGSQEFLN
jgi:hypothetical protein